MHSYHNRESPIKCDPGAQTSHEGQFIKIEIYESESWINDISIDVWFEQYLKIWNLSVQKI